MDEQEPDSIYAVDLPKVKAVCLILSHRAAGGVFCGVSPRAVCRCGPGRAGLCLVVEEKRLNFEPETPESDTTRAQ